MIKIFYFDSNYKSNGENDIIRPNENGKYEVPSNATDIPPQPGLYQPIYFDKEKQQWIGTSKEEFEKKNGVEENQAPIQNEAVGSDEELRKLFANMQIQLVQANMMVAQLSQQNAKLAQDTVRMSQEIENLKGAEKDENVIS